MRVGVRIVRGPHHAVVAHQAHRRLQRVVLGVGRDHALPLEVLRRLHAHGGEQLPPRLQVSIHAVEPVGEPGRARLEEGDAQGGVPLEDAGQDEPGARRHLLEGMREDVEHGRVLEAVAPEGGDAVAEALVHRDGDAERRRALPEALVGGVMDGPSGVRIRAHERAPEAELLGSPLELAERGVEVDERQHGDPEQA